MAKSLPNKAFTKLSLYTRLILSNLSRNNR